LIADQRAGQVGIAHDSLFRRFAALLPAAEFAL
jgi:hypothetical protein